MSASANGTLKFEYFAMAFIQLYFKWELNTALDCKTGILIHMVI